MPARDAYDRLILAGDPVAYWPLGAGLDNADGSLYDWTLAAGSLAVENLEGRPGLSLLSGQYRSSVRLPQAAYTLEAWIRWSGSTPYADGAILSDFGGAAVTGSMLVQVSSTGYVNFLHRTVNINTGRVPPVGRWCHLAGTWDGATARLYMDGELRASAADSTAPGTGSTAYSYLSTFGNAETNRRFNGFVDRAAMFSRAIDENEIRARLRTWEAVRLRRRSRRAA